MANLLPSSPDTLIEVGKHECVTCLYCATTFASVHPACPLCSERRRWTSDLTPCKRFAILSLVVPPGHSPVAHRATETKPGV